MTEEEARRELTVRPLVFGDTKQIAARDFLRAFEEAKEKWLNCPQRSCHHEINDDNDCNCLDFLSSFKDEHNIRRALARRWNEQETVRKYRR